MCASHEKSSIGGFFTMNVCFTIATVLGLVAGSVNVAPINAVATALSEVFINLFKLVSLPIIFLSIVSTASGMESFSEIKVLGRKVLKYTLLTTVIAASVALGIFVLIDPVRSQIHAEADAPQQVLAHAGYLKYLINTIPSNFVQPFSENHVIGVLFMAIVFSLATLSLPHQNRTVLHTFFASLYAAIMKMTTWIVKLMPVAIFAFITLFIRDLREGLEVTSLALYLACVVLANLIQGVVVLPLLLKMKEIPVIKLARAMLPALSVAFFTKSSSGALPTAMRCAEERAGISRKIASFSLPLCTSINMNGCAAFILTTVLFVSMSNGIPFSGLEMVMWIAIATIAAIGNAGVPMGCYFLSSAFLAAMNVPLNILGVILPFYALIDMLETAINVWSDSCVTAIVQQEVTEESLPAAEMIA